jgi:hypothetical protein
MIYVPGYNSSSSKKEKGPIFLVAVNCMFSVALLKITDFPEVYIKIRPYFMAVYCATK